MTIEARSTRQHEQPHQPDKILGFFRVRPSQSLSGGRLSSLTGTMKRFGGKTGIDVPSSL